MAYVQKLVTEDSFDAMGKLVKEGQIGSFDTDRLNGKEPHLHDVPGAPMPVVEVAALAPTGPNPTMPQQIPPDAYQTAGGGYARAGAVLTAERTLPEEQRRAGLVEPGDNAEGEYAEKLAAAQEETARLRAEIVRLQSGAEPNPFAGEGNVDNSLVEGTVAELTADLGGKSDDELAQMRAAEIDREKPRKGILSAIDAELDKRKESAEG